MHNIECTKRRSRGVKMIEGVVFNVKWMLPLFYLGLAIVMVLYGFAYAKEIYHVLGEARGYSTEQMKIVVLDFVDIVMVANLVKMIIAGSYNSFVSKEHGQKNENISSGMLKIKISTSVLVVCMINLLRAFVGGHLSPNELMVKLSIFGAFMVATSILGGLEYLHIKGEALEKELPHE